MTTVIVHIKMCNGHATFCVSYRAVDPSDALSLPGVRTFINADDVPGSNSTGYYVCDEEIFATGEVHAKLMPCTLLENCSLSKGTDKVPWTDIHTCFRANGDHCLHTK